MAQAAVERDCSVYLPLYKAALQGDWESALSFFFAHGPDAVMAKITSKSAAALHIAVGSGRGAHFVRELLEVTPAEALEALTDLDGQTALHYAAISGDTEAAELLVARSPRLPNTRSNTQLVPLHTAALYGQKKMVLYLMTVTEDTVQASPFADEPGVELLNVVIGAGFYDVALQLVDRHPRLATLKSSTGNTALNTLASRKPSAIFQGGSPHDFWRRSVHPPVDRPVMLKNFFSIIRARDLENPVEGSHLDFWEGVAVADRLATAAKEKLLITIERWQGVDRELDRRLAPWVDDVADKELMHRQLAKCLCMKIMYDSRAASIFKPAILSAARAGNHEVVEEILESFPSAIWSGDEEGRDIFQLAVMNRHESVFNLLYQTSEHRRFITRNIDNEGNNMLHLAGRLAPPWQLNRVSGAALQMQRELQWYKEVDKFIHPDDKQRENSTGKTPQVVFTEEHRDLVEKGERWMKDAARSCTVVSVLVTAAAFAASINVPRGHNGSAGIPNFIEVGGFTVFVISDALSLISSAGSLLIFLSILTARCEEPDFLIELPHNFILGMAALFASIATMMISFCVALYLLFGHKKAWILALVGCPASLTVLWFVLLQFLLLFELFESTHGRRIFGKQSERLL